MGEALYQIMGRHQTPALPERKPSWLKVKAPGGPNYLRLKQLLSFREGIVVVSVSVVVQV